MGVDMSVTVQVEDEDGIGLYRIDVCKVWCGRWYHWQRFLDPYVMTSNRFTFRFLNGFRDDDIHDGKVKDTDLYRIMKALAEKYGKRHVYGTVRLD
jgi:hypothetical protein